MAGSLSAVVKSPWSDTLHYWNLQSAAARVVDNTALVLMTVCTGVCLCISLSLSLSLSLPVCSMVLSLSLSLSLSLFLSLSLSLSLFDTIGFSLKGWSTSLDNFKVSPSRCCSHSNSLAELLTDTNIKNQFIKSLQNQPLFKQVSFTCVLACVHVCLCMFVCVFLCLCVCVCVCVCFFLCFCVCVCVCVCVCEIEI